MGSAATPQAPRRASTAWRGVLVAAALAAIGASCVVAVPAARAAPGGPASTEGGRGQAARGAAIYASSCAVCHGATGRGFEEAVAAFPADYRDCAACHQPTNAPRMPGSQVGLATMAFSLGVPPALAAQGRLARFGSAGGLVRYLRATMPRWAPGSLDDDAYLDVAAHLLRMVGALGEEETLDLLDARPID